MLELRGLTIPPATDTPDLSAYIPPYFALHIVGGHIGLPILVLTFIISKRAKRSITVINFCITWILFSVSYCLLLYRRYHESHKPPFALCLTQAAMIHATPPAAVLAGVALAIQIWHRLQPPWRDSTKWLHKLPRLVRLLMLILPPYILFLIICVASICIGLANPDTLDSSIGLYCTIDMKIFYAVPIFCAACMGLIVGISVGMLVRYFYLVRNVRQRMPDISRPRPQLSLFFRVLLFGVYSCVTLGTSLFFIFDQNSPVPYMIQSTLPLTVAILFGLHADIFRAWCFWKSDNEIDAGPSERRPPTDLIFVNDVTSSPTYTLRPIAGVLSV